MEILLEILDILDLLCPASMCRLGISKLPQRMHYKELDIITGRLKVRGWASTKNLRGLEGGL